MDDFPEPLKAIKIYRIDFVVCFALCDCSGLLYVVCKLLSLCVLLYIYVTVLYNVQL